MTRKVIQLINTLSKAAGYTMNSHARAHTHTHTHTHKSVALLHANKELPEEEIRKTHFYNNFKQYKIS